MSGSLYKAQDNKIHRFTARWDIRRTKDNKLLNFDMESGYKFNNLMQDKKNLNCIDLFLLHLSGQLRYI